MHLVARIKMPFSAIELLAAIGLTAGAAGVASGQDTMRVIDVTGRGIPYALVQVGRDTPAVSDSTGLVRLRTT